MIDVDQADSPILHCEKVVELDTHHKKVVELDTHCEKVVEKMVEFAVEETFSLTHSSTGAATSVPTAKSRSPGSANRLRFLALDGGESLCTVEQAALAWYAQPAQGGWRGVHSEGTELRMIAGLLLWPAIFTATPSATESESESESETNSPEIRFLSPFQDAPLDLSSPWRAYLERRETIEAIINQIEQHADNKAWLRNQVRATWAQKLGTSCRWVRWDATPIDCEELSLIAACLGGRFWAPLLRHWTIDPAGMSGGLPDLLLWQPPTTIDADTDEPVVAAVRFVEVKGPNDALSDQQRAWLQLLDQLGADVEVAYVNHRTPSSVGSPQLKRARTL
jgi:Fanconi-associated nuclease 1